MNLYIRIVNEQPFEHPIFEDNFVQAFPHIDIHNLPPDFARFERVEQPIVGVYEVYEGVTYEWFDNIVKDVHHLRPMTEEEKTAKQPACSLSGPERENRHALAKLPLDEPDYVIVL